MIYRTTGHYRIVEKLGGGGMGIVHQAEDARLHRFGALKFLPGELYRDNHNLERSEQIVSIPCDLGLAALKLDPTWASLQNHPRFQVMIHKFFCNVKCATVALAGLDGLLRNSLGLRHRKGLSGRRRYAAVEGIPL